MIKLVGSSLRQSRCPPKPHGARTYGDEAELTLVADPRALAWCEHVQEWLSFVERDDEMTLAWNGKVHQYLRPDGSICASGQPVPKHVGVDGIRYRACSKQATAERHHPAGSAAMSVDRR
jgi:hypothetical protein